MSKEATKKKNITKKLNVPPNEQFETFLKLQQNNMSRLKKELKSVISEVHLSNCETAEKDKCILELEHSVNQREAEIHKLRVSLDNFKEENSQIFQELNLFKVKFYQLETDYDSIRNQQILENENLLDQLQKQQTNENQEVKELSLKCQDLQKRLQNTTNDLTQLNRLHMETLQNLEQMKRNFEQQQTEFDLYKNQVNQERKLSDEKIKIAFDDLKDELQQKDETLKQCISDKNELEKEKNCVIVELNNKIQRIEMAFSQPTKAVKPIVTLPQQANSLNDNSNSENSIENVAISKPQLRKALENIPLKNISNNENQQVKQIETQRNYKFRRPVQPATSSQQSNIATNFGANRKRTNQPLRQSSAAKAYNDEFSASSSDEDYYDDDDDSNYNRFSQQIWRPNNCGYVPDTDASEGFPIPKRLKK